MLYNVSTDNRMNDNLIWIVNIAQCLGPKEVHVDSLRQEHFEHRQAVNHESREKD